MRGDLGQSCFVILDAPVSAQALFGFLFFLKPPSLGKEVIRVLFTGRALLSWAGVPSLFVSDGYFAAFF